MKVAVLVLDSVRAADVDKETMPFLSSQTTIEELYSPSTWTLPTHASIYSGKSPITHGATRPGDQANDASVLNALASNGFSIGAFSENPYFSPRFGFGDGVDYFDADVHLKPYRSANSFEHLIESEQSRLQRYVSGAEQIIHSNEKIHDALNALALVTGLGQGENNFYGERVLSHASSWLAEQGEALAITNLLDAHQPHLPTEYADDLGYSFTRNEIRGFQGFDGMEFIRGEDISTISYLQPFDSWEQFFERLQKVYRTQIRHLDAVIEDFVSKNPDTIMVITSDHGQMLGEEGWFDHHGILHPNAVRVPFAVVNSDLTINSRTVHEAIIEVLEEHTPVKYSFDRDRQSIIASDGIARYVPEKWGFVSQGELGLSKEDLLCRRVALASDGLETVYESPWGCDTIEVAEYDLSDDTRQLRKKREYQEGDLDVDIERWLRTSPHNDSVDANVANRLEELGYL